MVGGFSFYDRAEIKDMISYLKVIQNPDDSISLLRVINTPTRGIGKGTIDTLENLALETGLSLWGAVGEAIRRQLLPQRALAALKSFQQLIEDGRAMLAGNFAEQLRAAKGRNVGSGRLARCKPTSAQSRQGRHYCRRRHRLRPHRIRQLLLRLRRRGIPNPANGQPMCSAPNTRRARARKRSHPSRESARTPAAFPTPTVNTADLLKFLIDRTGYIKLLEEEDTPEAFSRIENLRELVNAAMDSRDRAETLDQFLDHAALVADADDYDARAQITLMSLHAAKGLEFPLVFLSGLEEGLFPHSRTMLVPEDIEEERRLCYVGMTRAMDQLILTRAVYRRRYGTDLPEASVPSRFLEEVPAPLFEELGTSKARNGMRGRAPRPSGGAQPRA